MANAAIDRIIKPDRVQVHCYRRIWHPSTSCWQLKVVNTFKSHLAQQLRHHYYYEQLHRLNAVIKTTAFRITQHIPVPESLKVCLCQAHLRQGFVRQESPQSGGVVTMRVDNFHIDAIYFTEAQWTSDLTFLMRFLSLVCVDFKYLNWSTFSNTFRFIYIGGRPWFDNVDGDFAFVATDIHTVIGSCFSPAFQSVVAVLLHCLPGDKTIAGTLSIDQKI